MRLTDSGATCFDGADGGLWDVDNIDDILKGVSSVSTQPHRLTPASRRPFMSLHAPIEQTASRYSVILVGCGYRSLVLGGVARNFKIARRLFVGFCTFQFLTHCSLPSSCKVQNDILRFDLNLRIR